ncbi:MAG: PH domain-containing protein [Candidatus Bathyarchaeota archaeon]|nr:PH domain-containing protein [Candidatus Bathyarchaeota archaeon]
MENLNVPKGVEKYKENDLKLLAGERVEKIASVLSVSKLRSFVLCILTALLGFTLYSFFSQPAVTTESLALPVGVLIVTYFVWHCKITESGKKLVFSLVKYSLMIALLSFLVSFIGSVLSPIFQEFSLPSFSLNPIENVSGILSYLADLVNTSFMPYAGYCRLFSLGLAAAGFAAIPFIYLNARGTLYYVTNKRIVVREKSGTVQVTTLPLDNLVEVTAFQGFFGRLFSYGDVVLTVSSGGGVTNSLKPKSASPLGTFYKVKRRLEGIREVWEIKDLIITLRERYVQANYLVNMEKELRRIREAVEEKPAKLKSIQYVK